MADEFIKGLAALIIGGLGWLTVGGWYRTPSFEEAQLTGHLIIEEPTVYDQIALFIGDAMGWFAVIGALTFWVVIPAIEEGREAWAERRSN